MYWDLYRHYLTVVEALLLAEPKYWTQRINAYMLIVWFYGPWLQEFPWIGPVKTQISQFWTTGIITKFTWGTWSIIWQCETLIWSSITDLYVLSGGHVDSYWTQTVQNHPHTSLPQMTDVKPDKITVASSLLKSLNLLEPQLKYFQQLVLCQEKHKSLCCSD